jgi:hypothetical protein
MLLLEVRGEAALAARGSGLKQRKNSAARKEERTPLLFNSFTERLSFLQQFRVKIGASF